MLSSPRSELELTARSSAGVVCNRPSMTRCTFPDAFSRTKMSLRPTNAIPIGWVRPATTVETERAGSNTAGPTAWL